MYKQRIQPEKVLSLSAEMILAITGTTPHWNWRQLPDPLQPGRELSFPWELPQQLLDESERHSRCLQLRAQHPEAFGAVARFIFSQTAFRPVYKLQACAYLPELWKQAPAELHAELRRSSDWARSLQQAEAGFLVTLPPDLLNPVMPLASDYLWLRGGWTGELQKATRDAFADEPLLQLAMLRGEAAEVERRLSTARKREGYAAVWSFLDGRRDEAFLAFQKLIARRRPELPVFPPFVGLFARLCALSQGDLHLFRDRRLGSYPWLDRLLDRVQTEKPPTPVEELENRGLSGLVLWCLRTHLTRPPRLPDDTRDYLEKNGFSRMLDQLSDRPQWAWLPPTVQEAPWETLLRLLDHRAEVAPSAPQATAKGGALFWHLAPPVLVFYHDRKAGPEDSPEELTGKYVSSKTLLSRLPDYLTEKDRVALGKVRLDQNGEAVLSVEVLRALVGHPRVYRKNRRVQLQERVQQLRVLRSRDGLRLTLHPEFGYADYVLEESGDVLTFWTRSPAEKQLAPLLNAETIIPTTAEPRLAETLRRWVPRIEVEAEKALDAFQKAHYRADQLRLRIRPATRGWRFDWIVRCPELASYVRPALEGLAQERLVEGATAALVERDLAAEEARFQEILAGCPALPESTAFRCQDPGEMLDIVEQCQAAGLALEWPEGQAWKVRRASALRLTVTQGVSRGQAQDWFGLQGDLQLDSGESVELSAILSAARLGLGNYLQLGPEHFVLLEAELRQQVEQLSDLVDPQEMKLPGQAIPSLAALELSGLTSDEAFQARLETLQQAVDYRPAVPRSLQADLRDYQVEGFQWLARHARMGSGACLADDMGLGKTLQALALMLHHRSDGPHLVVCPVSVMNQWAAEMGRFAPSLRPLHYEGKDRDLKGLKAGDVVLCSYAILQRDARSLQGRNWAVAVLDEAQAIKNPESQTARAAFVLKAKIRLATTGTPIENRLSELWSLFGFLNPGLLGTLAAFRRRFEAGEGQPRARLRALIAPFVLRRLKSQVLAELPPRTELSLTVQLSPPERELYERLRREAQDNLAGGQALELLAHLTRLRQACCHPQLVLKEKTSLSSSKLEAVMELLQALRGGRHRALVFSQFTSFLDLLEETLKGQAWEYLRLDGSTPAGERRRRVEAFQDGQGDLFLISLKAGGSGLNLTGADYVVHLDPWWNPAAEDQASDRAHRIGQQRPVTVYRLIAENTIEEKVVQLHGHKRELAQSVLEGRDQSSPLRVEELRELLRQA